MERFLFLTLTIIGVFSFCGCLQSKNYDTGRVILENSKARWQFDKQSLGLISIEQKYNSGLLTHYYMNGDPNQIWELHFRDEQGIEYIVDGLASTAARMYKVVTNNSTSTLLMKWTNTGIEGTKFFVNVSVQIELQPSGLAECKIFVGPVGEDLALNHYYFMMLKDIGTKKFLNDSIYVPDELGLRLSQPKWRGSYPSGPASMPFILYHHKSKNDSISPCPRGVGLFYGALDPRASQKELKAFATPKGLGLTAKLFPENNVLPFTRQLDSETTFLIGPFCGDWWDGAQIYRTWALNNAPWIKPGPIKSRKEVPQWFKETTLWINSHWTTSNLNDTLGNPLIFERNVNRFLAVFEKSKYFNASNVAVHWYVWHQIGWETNFPNFFPAKERFDEVTKRLQEQGVKILPYVNGRIYDINNQSWVREEGEIHCCKASAARLKPSRTTWYIEDYTNNQQWAVMCPATSFWQNKLKSLTSEFAEKHFVDGLYIDQLASKPPVLCFDPKHNHARGGGSYWSDGYNHALIQMRSTIRNSFALVSESNAEVYLPNLDGFLVIGGYKNCPMVPIFQTVYSNHAITFGQYFSSALVAEPAYFTKQMAMMFAYGSQPGWFALEGIDGWLPYLEEEGNADVVDFIASLMRYRTLGSEYLVDGQLMRPLIVAHNNLLDSPIVCTPTIASAVWSSQEKNSLGIFVVNGEAKEEFVAWKLDAVVDYAMEPAKTYCLTKIMLSGKSELIQVFNSSRIEFKTWMANLEAAFYELQPIN